MTTCLQPGWSPVLVALLSRRCAGATRSGAGPQPNSGSTAIFVNADAGAVTPQRSRPHGWVCDVGPATVDLAPGTYVFVHYQCEQANP